MPKKLERTVNETLRSIIMIRVYLAEGESFDDFIKRVFCPYCGRRLYNPVTKGHYYIITNASIHYDYDENIEIPLIFKFLCLYCQRQFLVGVTIIRRKKYEDS